MILSVSSFQMIYIILLVLTIQIFRVNTNNMYELSATLQQRFGYDFRFPPKIGTVLFWKISGNYETFTPLRYSGEEAYFGSEEVYLLFTQNTVGMFTAYYWLGKEALLIDRKMAAKYAILLAQVRKSVSIKNCISVYIARETENMESDSFRHTIKMFKRHVSSSNLSDHFTNYLNKQFPSPRPNIYVVQGEKRVRIKKIPHSLGLQWLRRNDNCFLLEVGYEVSGMLPLNNFCGTAASEKQINRALEISDEFMGYFIDLDNRYFHSIENNKKSNDFKRFLDVLEDSRFHNPNEVDDSDDHLISAAEFVNERDRSVTLFEVTNEGLKKNPRKPIRCSTFRNDSMGYLLDSKSVAGVFLILTDADDVNVRITAIQLAEEYLDETYPLLSSGTMKRMRMIEKQPDDNIIDFEVNLSDFPYLGYDIPDDELW